MATSELTGLRQFDWPELGPVYRGKVRDCYWREPNYGIIVTTDRISAFDAVFPQPIARKGEVLQALAVHFLQLAEEIVPSHLLEVPDPNVMLVRRAQPLPVEFVIRGFLTGSAWRDYEAGRLEQHYGLSLPPGMVQHQQLEQPIITPTTKEQSGHDRPIHAGQAAELVGGGARWQEISELLHALYRQGTQWAESRQLVLVDCKYELGLVDHRLVLIDELHTPDSSRYWTSISTPPHQLSKEFFREWLLAQGATGVIDIPDSVCAEISARYLELHQRLLGCQLPAPEPGDPQERIRRRLSQHPLLKGLVGP